MIYMLFGNATSPAQTSCCPSCCGRYNSDNLSMVGKRALHGCAVRCWKNFRQAMEVEKKTSKSRCQTWMPSKNKHFLLLLSWFLLFNFWLFYVAFFRWYRQVPHPTKGWDVLHFGFKHRQWRLGQSAKKTLARWLLMVDEWQVSHPEQPCWRGTYFSQRNKPVDAVPIRSGPLFEAFTGPLFLLSL